MDINNNTTDEEIVELTRKNDKELFAHLIDRYEAKLAAYIKRLVANSPEAEDLVQQAFINAFVNLNNFDTDQKFSSWIYRIAHNLAVNWLKKKKANISLDDDDEAMRLRLKDKVDLEDDLMAKEAGTLLIDAINRLPEKFKEPFMLKYLEDKSYEEISFILRLPKNTVGTFIGRAKKLLKADLEKNYVR